MSQAPSAFTQAASQGYGDFSSMNDEDDHEQTGDDEQIPDGPQSPEPEDEETEENDNYGFTQTQERSYPAGIDSPEPEEDAEQQQQEEEEEPTGPESPSLEIQDEEEEEEEKPVVAKNKTHRTVQIANDSDSDEEIEQPKSTKTNSTTNQNFLKQFVVKKDEQKKHHKKRSHDDQHSSKDSKRSKRKSHDEEEQTSDVNDVVDDIFGKNDDEEREELEEELAALNNEETAETEENPEQDDNAEQFGTYDDDIQQELDELDDEPKTKKKNQTSSNKNDILYQIDLIMEKKREQRRTNRAAKSGDTNIERELDKLVQITIDRMRTACEEDRIFNENQKPATAKLQLLPTVEQQIYRADLTEYFKENGVLSVFKEWLSPLPDKSLPNIKIRESLIRMLQLFTDADPEALKDSGIGKAVMYLYKHPRETKENKLKLIKIIHDWARPIFNLETDYKNLTREERERRDVDQATLKRQTSSSSKSKSRNTEVDMSFLSDRRSNEDGNDDDCPRARVPRASNRDYVVRPTSKVEVPEKDKEPKQKTVTRLDEVKRRQQDRKRQNRPTPIVKLSIEGNRMHL